MSCSFCLAKSVSTTASFRRLCLNAQSKDPILSYSFYLRKEKLENEEKYRLQRNLPHDKRSNAINKVTPQTLSRWCYEPTQKITIGYQQLEWITKSKIEVNQFTPSTNEWIKKLNRTNTSSELERILRECYVFDVKEYERSKKVPFDPTDRWNPRKVYMYLDYPAEARMTKNIFTSAIFAVRKQFPQTRTLTTFDCATQVLFERQNYSALISQPGAVNLLSRSPLPAASQQNSSTEIIDHKFQDFYPLNPMLDFKKSNLYSNFESFGIFDEDSKYHPHTCFLPTDTLKPQRMQYAVCLIAFANALVKAHQIYGREEKEQIEPIVAQAIASSGFDLHFATCQLNTTCFSDDEGVKNQIWVTPNMPFFKSVRRELDLMVEDYNEEAGMALFAHILNGLNLQS